MPEPAYTVVRLPADEQQQEMLVALLSEGGYEGFVQQPDHLEAYLPTAEFDGPALERIAEGLGLSGIEVRQVPQENWNACWEADYPSVSVDDWVHIHPSFRTPEAGFAHTLCINPQMSFGTGHHPTTQLMLQQLREQNLAGTRVLDMGCGTGILGILAARLGAVVVAVDVESWAVANAFENFQTNDVRAEIRLGGIEALREDERFDLILANINRNVLLADLPSYARHLVPGGWLLLSGFFDFDGPVIFKKLEELHFTLHNQRCTDGWCSIAATFHQ